MVSLRSLGSPTLSALINLVAILVLSFNLLQNHILLHDQAVHRSSSLAAVSDHQPPTSLLRSSSAGNNDEYRGPVSLTIPQGKAVARTAARLSEEEDAKIRRAHYGGKGDPAHLGAFRLFVSSF